MSITLTTGILVAINGSTVENDTQAAVTSYYVDFQANTGTFIIQQGTITNGALVVGNYGTPITVSVNLGTGAWTSSNGKAGTLVGAAFTSFLSQVKSDRNLFETFASGNASIEPGTQVAWT